MLNYLNLDRWIIEFDTALRTLSPPNRHHPRKPQRPFPGELLNDGPMTRQEQSHAEGLMRVNHAGEVCAQALYQGQALTARSSSVQAQLKHAADEEVDHLAWCEQCLYEWHGEVSWLNPFWYSASLTLGALAGWMGDEISLGFVAEIERQVEAHLASHLEHLPTQALRARAVVQQMMDDEIQHAECALRAGGIEFPLVIQGLMRWTAKLMTMSSYYL
jgi:ubiquinone biosynthesis monooxygenase Coq7